MQRALRVFRDSRGATGKTAYARRSTTEVGRLVTGRAGGATAGGTPHQVRRRGRRHWGC